MTGETALSGFASAGKQAPSIAAREKLACISIDMEPDLRCPERRIRLIEEDDKLQSFVELFQRHQVPLTSFTVMAHAPRFARELAVLAKSMDVEFAVHSYSHDQTKPATMDEVRRAWDAFCDLWNSEPLGYRAPNCLIDAQGLQNLAEQGYRYDSSIVPSVRFDIYGYDNRSYGLLPFRCQLASGKTLIELPVACTSGARIPFIFSYVKLLGLSAFEAASGVMPLPDTVVTYLHPYDLYTSEIAGHIPGWKRYAHLRNGKRGPQLLEGVIGMLKKRGYRFVSMQTLAKIANDNVALPVRPMGRQVGVAA